MTDFGLDPDQEQEQLKYPQHLKAYAEKHKLSELFEIINCDLQKKSSDENEFVFKFEVKLSECKLSNILDFKSCIADILGQKSSAFRILKIEEGCLKVTIAVPEFVANSIFTEDGKLTPKQIQALRDLHIVWVKCGIKTISICDDVTLLNQELNSEVI